MRVLEQSGEQIMARDFTWPVTDYSVTLYGGTGLGWIQLRNDSRVVGYIYFRNEPPKDGGFGPGDEPYIIMSQPMSHWQMILNILQEEDPISIRGYQAAAGGPVVAYFGTLTDDPEGDHAPHLTGRPSAGM